MNESFAPAVTDGLPPANDRLSAADAAQSLSVPDGSQEDWRYSPIAEYDLGELSPSLSRPDAPSDLELIDELGYAARIVVVDGWVTAVDVQSEWVDKGLQIETADSHTIDVDDVTKFDYLHRAFSPETLRVSTPPGLVVSSPVLVDCRHSGGDVAAFPSIDIVVGESSDVTVVEKQTAGDRGFTVAQLTQAVGAAGNLRYVTIQDVSDQHVLISRLHANVGQQATLMGGYLSFGGKYARVRTDISLDGRGATGELVAAYYGDADQVLDYRTFQHHRARDTKTDLLFKGSVDDKSGSIYTGMIHIHPDGAGSNAVQTNRNIKLSEDAWAWSVPNLEIENSDVRCAHASTVNPIDDEQEFYLQARGVPPREADRLIVAGFFDDAINRIPVEAVRAQARELIASKLARR